jgi:hypothetical protein
VENTYKTYYVRCGGSRFGRWRLGLQMTVEIGYGKPLKGKIRKKKKRLIFVTSRYSHYFMHKTPRFCSHLALN